MDLEALEDELTKYMRDVDIWKGVNLLQPVRFYSSYTFSAPEMTHNGLHKKKSLKQIYR